MKSKLSAILDRAKDAASSAANWADLSNALFNPVDGLITRAYPTREEREAFMQTKEYRAIRELLQSAMDRSGLVEGATPQKSGRFVVRLPKTLHAALEREASEEGVSLNQLVVTKLAVQMSQLASGPHTEFAAIAQAYLETRAGYSTDRVIADPDMNRRFLHRCRELGLAGTDYELNWKLMRARKDRHLSRMPKTRKYTPRSIDDFEFSSEMAFRYVQQQVRWSQNRNVSLDTILCDPELAAQFDGIADKLAPGFSRLDYRWVALGVRKAAGRYWAKALDVTLPNFDLLGSVKSVKASRIPDEQGVYLFRCADEEVFVGHTDNLRTRVERHFDSSDKRGIPEWLYDPGRKSIQLALAPLPHVTTPTARKLIELKAVAAYTPLFNYIGGKSVAA
jgi:site-specific DNA-methyltransferase (adenine-specific)